MNLYLRATLVIVQGRLAARKKNRPAAIMQIAPFPHFSVKPIESFPRKEVLDGTGSNILREVGTMATVSRIKFPEASDSRSS
jgi:hypothetical protein